MPFFRDSSGWGVWSLENGLLGCLIVGGRE